MQKFIKIESKGIIDSSAFTLLGASTKRSDGTKIGFFGSGLKYSIAYLLRNSIDFKVFAEYKEIKFDVHAKSFRNQDFGVIWVDGRETSMTTEMGIDWEPWFIIREIYCNAIDEGDSAISIVDETKCVPIEDKTAFYIAITPEIQVIIDSWGDYFTEGRKKSIYSTKNQGKSDWIEFYHGGKNMIIYRKGIRVHFESLESQEKHSVFNYDLGNVEINESRVVKSMHSCMWEIRKHLQRTTDTSIITHLLNRIIGSWEFNLPWDYSCDYWTDEWADVLKDYILAPYENAGFWEDIITSDPELYKILPAKMIESLKLRFMDEIRVIGDIDGVSTKGKFRIVETLSKREQSLFNESKNFLKQADYEIKYPIKIVEFSNPKTLGQAKDDTIFISSKLFEMGRKEIVSCIIEEQEHLVTNYNDETREFQTHFIMKYVTALENLTGIYL